MKPFDLEKALAGAPVVTRDGRPVKIAGYNEGAAPNFKILGWINGKSFSWNSEGRFYGVHDQNEDLFMAPTERKEWVIRLIGGSYYSNSFDSKEKAEDFLIKWPGTIHEITITD